MHHARSSLRITMSEGHGNAKGDADEAETADVDITLIDEMLRLTPAKW